MRKHSSPNNDAMLMHRALRLAGRAYGLTSPNPMVGAVLVKNEKVIGQGWHHQAGKPHAEIEALRDAKSKGNNPRGATLYVSLEPCSTHGRTPPCTQAILSAGIKRVVVAATDPNPAHAGAGFKILKRSGLKVENGLLAAEANALNESFNHWIVHRTPFVTVKAAMTLDGKIATASGESKWITGEKARARGMELRQGADAVLVGINTIFTDDPSLTVRSGGLLETAFAKKRIVLDSNARTPLAAKVVSDEFAKFTTIVVAKSAPVSQVTALRKKVRVLIAPIRNGNIDLRWVLKKLGGENVTSILVEGGGEVNASFLLGGFAQRIAFFYAPKILGGRYARKAVGGAGIERLSEAIKVREARWQWLGDDLLFTGKVD